MNSSKMLIKIKILTVFEEFDNNLNNKQRDKRKSYNNNFQKSDFNEIISSDQNWRNRQPMAGANPMEDGNWRSNKEPLVPPSSDRYGQKQGGHQGYGRNPRDNNRTRGNESGSNKSYKNLPDDLDLSVLRDKSKAPPPDVPKSFNRTNFIDANS